MAQPMLNSAPKISRFLIPLVALVLAAGVAGGLQRPVQAAGGVIQLSATTYQVTEGDVLLITVTRPGGDGLVSATYTLSDGPATNAIGGDDYAPGTGLVIFNPGQTSALVVVTTLEDIVDEGTENLTITLTDPTQGATLGTPTVATIAILDDDGPPSFTVTNLTVLESVGTAMVTVTRGGNLADGQTVTVTTSNGGATAPGDYTASGPTVLVYGAGVSTQTFNVPIVNDTDDELGDETININLSAPNPGGGTLTNGTITIRDDENGIIEFASATYSNTEDDVTVTLSLKRTGNSLGTVTVNCDTLGGGSATSPADYTAFANQTITFSPGEITETCDVVIKEDALIEGNQTINLKIDTATGGAIIGDQDTAVLTIIDDDGVSTLQFSAPNYNVVEGVPTVTITVTRSGTDNLQATVVYTTSPDTAVAVGDYTHTTGTLTFPAGNNSQTFTVPITNDGDLEVTEKLILTLTNPTNASLGSQNTATITIADNDGLAPVVTSVTPDNGLTAGGTVVVILGANFTGTNSVKFGATEATTFTIDTDGKITATAPAHALGPVGVIVTNNSGVSNVDITYTFTEGKPAVTSLSPSSGPIGGGTIVVIRGLNFTGVNGVTFGGSSAAYTIEGDTKITVTAPAHAAGTFNVVVTNPAGDNTDTPSDDYTYSTASTFTYTLFFRWSLIVWTGANNADIQNALKGIENPDNPLTNNVFNQVTAVFTWDNAFQVWLGYFPVADVQNIPGANDFTTLKKGLAYWIAVVGPNQILWTVVAD